MEIDGMRKTVMPGVVEDESGNLKTQDGTLLVSSRALDAARAAAAKLPKSIADVKRRAMEAASEPGHPVRPKRPKKASEVPKPAEQPVSQEEQHKSTAIWITVMTPVGEIQSPYSHIYHGDEIVVMGLLPKSFKPVLSGDHVAFTIKIDDQLYSCLWSGLSFVDGEGITNIIVFKGDIENA